MANVIEENFHNSDVENGNLYRVRLARQRGYGYRRGDDAALIGLGGAGDIVVGTLGRASGWAK